MNIVVLAGRLSSPPRCTELPSGDVRWSFELSCPSDASAALPGVAAPGEQVVLSVPVAVAHGVPGIERYDTGTELVVAGVVRRRFYRAGGATQSRTEVVAQAVVPVTPRRPRSRAIALAARGLGRDHAAELCRTLVADGMDGVGPVR
jgi:single-strand DNA-binding protein